MTGYNLDESEWMSGGDVTAGGDVELAAPSGGRRQVRYRQPVGGGLA